MLMTHWLYLLRRPTQNPATEASQEPRGHECRRGLRPEEIAFRLKRRLGPAPVIAATRQKRFQRASQPAG